MQKFLMLALVVIYGCAKHPTGIVGTWESDEEYTYNGAKTQVTHTFEIFSDSTLSVSRATYINSDFIKKQYLLEGKWKIKGELLSIHINSTKTDTTIFYGYKLNRNRLAISNEKGDSTIFNRK